MNKVKRITNKGGLKVRFGYVLVVYMVSQCLQVCEEAKCPNIGECWGGGEHATATATIMVSLCASLTCHFSFHSVLIICSFLHLKFVLTVKRK